MCSNQMAHTPMVVTVYICIGFLCSFDSHNWLCCQLYTAADQDWHFNVFLAFLYWIYQQLDAVNAVIGHFSLFKFLLKSFDFNFPRKFTYSDEKEKSILRSANLHQFSWNTRWKSIHVQVCQHFSMNYKNMKWTQRFYFILAQMQWYKPKRMVWCNTKRPSKSTILYQFPVLRVHSSFPRFWLHKTERWQT